MDVIVKGVPSPMSCLFKLVASVCVCLSCSFSIQALLFDSAQPCLQTLASCSMDVDCYLINNNLYHSSVITTGT